MGIWRPTINGREIELPSEVATGEEIKRAAGISREVKMTLEKYDGTTIEVSNKQEVSSKDGSIFWPILTHINAKIMKKRKRNVYSPTSKN